MTEATPLAASPLRRIPALDGLRGVAIALVLVHHLFVFTPTGASSRWVESLVEFASHGVDLFFVLSGFLITTQLAAGRARPDFAGRFWRRRFAKIVPVYLLLVVLVFAAMGVATRWFGSDGQFAWAAAAQGNWPWYVLFASNLRNTLDARFAIPPLDVCWSLAIEVQFYVAAFLVARLFAPKHWGALCVGAIAGALLFRAGCVAAGANWIQILVLTPGRLDAFAFGGLAAIAGRALARVPLTAVAIVAACPLILPWSRALSAVEIGGYTLVAAACGVAVAHASAAAPAGVMRWLGAAVPSWLGKISYSLYLVHLPVRAVLRDRFLPSVRVLDGSVAWLQQAGFLVAGGVVCIAAGWAGWRFIEEPCRQYLIRLPGTAPAAAPVTSAGAIAVAPAEKFVRED